LWDVKIDGFAKSVKEEFLQVTEVAAPIFDE